MHINFRKLVLHNFLSFGDAELLFNDDGFIKVQGINNNPDDLATSNGSGKSGIGEAIVWTLTGDTIRGAKNIVNIYGQDGCFCELEFDIDNKVYKLIRAKDHKLYKTSLQIFIDGKDCSGKGIRDSEKLLEQYLPDLTASLLGSVIILGQGLPQKFTNNSPSARKELLEKLSKSDFMIEDLKKKLADRKLFHNTEIRKFEDQILKNQTEVSYMRNIISMNIDTINNMPDRAILETQYAEKEVQINHLDVELHQLDVNVQTAEIESEKLHAQLDGLIEQQDIEIKSIETDYAADIEELRTQEITLVSLLNSLQRDIDRIKNIVDICPTCGQHIPNIEKPDASSIQQEFDTQFNILKNHRIKINNVISNKQAELDQVYDKFKAQKDAITAKLSEVTEYRKKQNLEHIACSNTLLDAKTCLNNIKNQLDNNDTLKNNLLAQNTKLMTDISNTESQILYINTDKDLQQQKLDIITKFETAIKRDFRGYLLLNVIEYIQRRAKYYSSHIFETENLEFKLDGNNIYIGYNNKDYENLSGGEKQKIDLILQFSLRDMLANHLNFSSNILILDEIFDNLDQVGCEKVIDIVANMSDIRNIFIVTHRKDLAIPSDKEIVVVKSNLGISEIK